MSLLRMTMRDRAIYAAKNTPRGPLRHSHHAYYLGTEACDLIWNTIAAYGIYDTTPIVNKRPPFTVLIGHGIRGALIIRRMSRTEAWFRNLFSRVRGWFT